MRMSGWINNADSIFSYLFSSNQAPYLFYIDCISIKTVLYIRHITSSFLFFVYSWSCIVNQAIFFANMYENYMYVYRRPDISRTFFFHF
jgi:hypothetical protein